MAKANPFRFSTKYQDDETDLLYYGYRYYNASTGSWLARDPIGERASLNLNAFVDNSPIGAFDFLGLFDGCTCPGGPATMLPQPKRSPEKSLHIGFVQDFYTAVADDWGWITSDVSFRVYPEDDVLALKAKIEKELGPMDCIKSISFSGHGSARSLGISGNSEIASSYLANQGTHQRQLFDFLRSRMCKSNCQVYLKACDQAKDVGKDMMKQIATLLNADVVGYDDWYALLPFGNQYTACSDGRITRTGGLGIPYPFKPEEFGGKADYKRWKHSKKSKQTENPRAMVVIRICFLRARLY